MTVRNYSSSAVQTALTAPISSSATSIVVGSVSGFPITYPYALSIDADNVNKEIVDVTAAVGTTLTVTRAVDGTAGVAHTLGAKVSHDHSARDFRDSRTHENATSNVHGVTGALVGATQTQVLTNKDLTDPSNNLGLPTGTVTLTGTQTLTNKTLTDAVFSRNSKAAATPYSVANLAALPTTGVSDGDLGATADGKLYQRRSGAWLEVGSGSAPSFTSVTVAGSGWTNRSFTVADHGNGLVTLRGTAKPATTVTVTSGIIDLYGDRILSVTFPSGKFPGRLMGINVAVDNAGDEYPLFGYLAANGDLSIQYCPLLNSIPTSYVLNVNLTFAV